MLDGHYSGFFVEVIRDIDSSLHEYIFPYLWFAVKSCSTELELVPEANGIQLSLISPKGTLVRKHGVLVHHGSDVVDFDIAGFINVERHCF
jgi:hypothetical protein